MNALSIGVTGSQRGITTDQLLTLTVVLARLRAGGARWFHHGDCVGADEAAHACAVSLGYWIVIHPPEDDSKRAYCGSAMCSFRQALPYLKRNREIVKESNLLIALPAEPHERLRSGTWATVREAAKRELMTAIIWPDGTLKAYQTGWMEAENNFVSS